MRRSEIDAATGEWEEFRESLMVFRLLESATDRLSPAPEPRESATACPMTTDVATFIASLGRDLASAFCETVAEMGVELHSISIDVGYESPGALEELVGERQPTVRYQVVVDGDISSDQLERVHAWVRETYLRTTLATTALRVSGRVLNLRIT